MPDITYKEIKDKYQREIDGINLQLKQLTEEIQRLQSIVDTPPKTDKEPVLHLQEEPLTSEQIQSLYKGCIKAYNPEDYKDT